MSARRATTGAGPPALQQADDAGDADAGAHLVEAEPFRCAATMPRCATRGCRARGSRAGRAARRSSRGTIARDAASMASASRVGARGSRSRRLLRVGHCVARGAGLPPPPPRRLGAPSHVGDTPGPTRRSSWSAQDSPDGASHDHRHRFIQARADTLDELRATEPRARRPVARRARLPRAWRGRRCQRRPASGLLRALGRSRALLDATSGCRHRASSWPRRRLAAHPPEIAAYDASEMALR